MPGGPYCYFQYGPSGEIEVNSVDAVTGVLGEYSSVIGVHPAPLM
jgi:hypothetical protein